MMTELDSLKLLAGGRFIYIRFFFLLLGILATSAVAYFSVAIFPLVLVNAPFFLSLLLIILIVNLFFLLGHTLATKKGSLPILEFLNLSQIVFDLGLIFLILSLIGQPQTLLVLLFFIPILEAVLLFGRLEAFGTAVIASSALYIFTIIPPYTVPLADQVLTLKLFSQNAGNNEPFLKQIHFLAFTCSFMLLGLILPYYNALLRPRGLSALKKTYLNRPDGEDGNSDQIQWVKNYSKKLEENNRLLRAKELELSLAQQKLDMLEHAKSEFISVATHQLRTPLSAIKWTFNMILSGQLGEINAEQKEFLDKGYESSLRMIGIVNNLVHIDHNTAKKEAYNFTETDLVELIKNISFEFSNQVESKNIHIQVNMPSNVLPKIDLDPNKIRMVIENILDNAIKYTPRGGNIVLSITDENLNSANQSINISVKDSGVGIPLDEQKKIFRKFFRASNARLQEPDGSGIGLYIAKDIIERHQGTLWFESGEGQGTTFFITLPIHQNIKTSV